MRRLGALFAVILMTVFLNTIVAYAGNVENSHDFGYIYWYGGEDVSYNKDEKALVNVEKDQDDVDMVIDMNMKDIEKPNYEEDKEAVQSIPEEDEVKRSTEKKPLIAIIIDDMGVNREMSDLAQKELEPEVTFSFLPYAADIQLQVDDAKKKGHEVILHLPWEAERKTANPGPYSLMVKQPKDEIVSNLEKNLDAFKGYDGVNNHMGSKFSHYKEGIELVMEELHKRNLYFLDSRTAPHSIAERIAIENKVSATHRNVFLDHVESKEFVDNALKEVENIALHSGTVVAIGHPKQVTIDGLVKWLPTLKERGFEVVTLKRIIEERQSASKSK